MHTSVCRLYGNGQICGKNNLIHIPPKFHLRLMMMEPKMNKCSVWQDELIVHTTHRLKVKFSTCP